MSAGSMAQFGSVTNSDIQSGESAVHVQPHQTGIAKPRPMRTRVLGLSSKNLSTANRRTSWEVSHSADPDDLLGTPLPYDAYSGGKSYRDFPQ